MLAIRIISRIKTFRSFNRMQQLQRIFFSSFPIVSNFVDFGPEVILPYLYVHMLFRYVLNYVLLWSWASQQVIINECGIYIHIFYIRYIFQPRLDKRKCQFKHNMPAESRAESNFRNKFARILSEVQYSHLLVHVGMRCALSLWFNSIQLKENLN